MFSLFFDNHHFRLKPPSLHAKESAKEDGAKDASSVRNMQTSGGIGSDLSRSGLVLHQLKHHEI